MCWRCWNIAEQASNGEIGAFWHSDMVFSITHEVTGEQDYPELQKVREGIIEHALEKMPEDMLYAMLAGVPVESDYDADTGVMTLKTKNPVAVVKLNGKVTVYERKNDGE